MNKIKTISFISLIIIVILWGIVPVIGKYLFNNAFYSPALLIATRALIATIVMVLFVLITKQYKELNKSYLICIIAGLILGAAYLFQFIGLETTSTSKNTFLESFSVIATPLTLLIMIKEKPSIYAIISSLLCLVGAFILCGDGWDFSSLLKPPSLGDIFSAIGGALFGVNIAFTQIFAKNKNPFIYVSIQMLVMAIMSFIYAFSFERPLLFSWEIKNILIVLFLAIFCTALCWIVRAFAVRHVSATTIAVMNPMSAVIATSISLALGQETFNFNLLIGALIIIASILLSSLGQVHLDKKKDEMSRKE